MVGPDVEVTFTAALCGNASASDLEWVYDAAVGKRLYINPHYFVFADFGRKIDNTTGIPCAYAVHEWRQVRTDAKGRYQGESADYTGVVFTALGNRDLKPERSTELELGAPVQRRPLRRVLVANSLTAASTEPGSGARGTGGRLSTKANVKA